MMKRLELCSIAALLASLAGCSDDATIVPGDGGTGGTQTGNAGSAGDGGTSSGGTSNGGTSSGGTSSGGTANGGSGGTGSDACDLSGAGKPRETIPVDPGSMTLTSDTVWELDGVTLVGDGETLTIEPCTRIEGQPVNATLGASVLVIQRGGQINAAGEADAPILFTSFQEPGSRTRGSWGGVVLLGRAVNNLGVENTIEGLPPGPDSQHGGADNADNSGVMTYVRIEYPGFEIADGNEINGLTMGSVGSGTEIHHIMVANTLDDCFEWFGGTVDAHHLIANNCGDDMFDADQGYQGEWDTLFGRMIDGDSSDPNGYELDNNNANPDLTPTTTITSSKVTLCGPGEGNVAETTNGGVFRRGVTGEFTEQVFTGFNSGVSLRDPFGTAEDPRVVLTESMFYGNFTNNIGAIHETNMLDPVPWFELAGRNNSVPETAPFTLEACQAADGPGAAVTGSAVGAFADEADWMDGAWVDWALN